jgi:periplasmic divalent cation tolerance protein
MSAALVYMTAGDRQEAERVGQALIESKLAACVNILDGMQSMFWWQGKVEQEGEIVVIAKTRDDLVPQLTEKVKSVHSYDCPCVVAVPVIDGNPDFLQWIRDETGETS